MLIPKPSIQDILTVQPDYSDPEYADTLQIIIDRAYATYTIIGDLPQDKQLMAFGLAVCHLFSIACWKSSGYAAVPTTLSTRNSAVKFAQNGSRLFGGSICGDELYNLINSNISMGVYAAEKTKDCSCSTSLIDVRY